MFDPFSGRIKEFNNQHDFLSNTHPSTFFYNGVKYKSVANAYYSLRAESESDATKIRESSIEEVVKLGKAAKPRQDWQSMCEMIMRDLLRQKFGSPFLAQRLIETGDSVLGNDRNFVGKLLMEIREEIKREQSCIISG